LSLNSPNPTAYPAINLILQRLLSEGQTVLGDTFSGMYLYGSLASGDFNPHTSDIDFLVVTQSNLSTKVISALETLHFQLAVSGLPWATKLEGAYMPFDMLPRFKPNDLPFPQVNEGRFYIDRQGVDWVLQRHTLREHERIVSGPSLRGLIEPVTPDQMRQAVQELLRTWWTAILTEPARLQSSEYQAYAILSMCRALYTLRCGALVSKPVSAQWAMDNLDVEWTPLITEAIQWRRGKSMNRLKETLDFIRFVIHQSQQFEMTREWEYFGTWLACGGNDESTSNSL
jgi:predicted nucleotidyltransferase